MIPEQLRKVREELDAGGSRETTLRELLNWFQARRRGRHIVAEIRAALRQLDLTTVPDFDSIWMYGSVSFERRGKQEPPKPGVVTMTASPEKSAAQVNEGAPEKAATVDSPPFDPPIRTLEGQDSSYSIKKLDAANTVPVSVGPTASIAEAVTLMLANDYSQLPVMQGDRSVKGVFSWKSFGSRLAMKRKCEKVADAMDSVRTISSEASIFQVAEILAVDEVVLVQASATDNKIVGIVTIADMAQQFRTLGEPYFLIGEIENSIRVLLDGKFGLQELKAAKNPGDGGREIESVADLTFGEYVRLFQSPVSWEKCNLQIDRGTFVKHLEKVRDVRNDVMHFEPEGIETEVLASMRRFAQFLSRLA